MIITIVTFESSGSPEIFPSMSEREWHVARANLSLQDPSCLVSVKGCWKVEFDTGTIPQTSRPSSVIVPVYNKSVIIDF